MAERERLLKERDARRQANAVPQAAPPAQTAPAPQQSDTDLLPDVAPSPGEGPPQMEPSALPPEQ